MTTVVAGVRARDGTRSSARVSPRLAGRHLSSTLRSRPSPPSDELEFFQGVRNAPTVITMADPRDHDAPLSTVTTAGTRTLSRGTGFLCDSVYAVSMATPPTSTRKRSIVKALTYRVVIVCLDFLAIYLFTHKVEVALGFMIVSNIYTTVGYFVHERIWARIGWGKAMQEASKA
jgi:uncharacterized membrane protein